MEQRVSLITLGVADLQRSREFYEHLGWRRSIHREEVDVVLAEAKASGGKLLKPAQEAFWGGYSGYFSDPDGFLWEVAWNPSFQIGEDGSIRVPD